MQTHRSRRLYRQARSLFPGGVSSPVRAFAPYPRFLHRGRGAYVYDVDGNRYIDCCMAFGPLILGHAHPYEVKYASAFYGPFREAAEGAPKFGDRRSHQMDPGSAVQALREARLDLAEGADVLMVKPAMPYLDILATLRREADAPLAAFQVSGEYAALKTAGAHGSLDEEAAVLESLTAIKRAGADFVLTYFAKEYAARLA